MVKIGVSDLMARLTNELNFEFQDGWSHLKTANATIPVIAPVQVWGSVIYTGRVLLVRGKVKTALELTCDRCLSNFSYTVNVPLEVEYARSIEIDELDYEEDDKIDEVKLLEGDYIDLKQAVEETLILALLMKTLCEEDCRGLCFHCGQNLNEGECQCDERMVDSRLAVLEKLLKKMEGET